MSTNSTMHQPLRRAANLGRSRLSRRPEPAESRLRAKLPALPGRKENHFHHA